MESGRIDALVTKEAPLNPKHPQYGALGDDSTDDQTALAAAAAALPANGGEIFLDGSFRHSGTLTFDDKRSVKVLGLAGQGSGSGSRSALVYTGTGTRAISARSTSGFSLEDLWVRYTSGSFTGSLIDLSQSAALQDTQLAYFKNCLIGSGTPTVRSALLLNLDKALNLTSINCNFSGGNVGVQGRSAAGVYSNVHRFYGGRFGYMETANVKNAGQAWLFSGVAMQQLYTGGVTAGAGGFIADSGIAALGLTFQGCWFGDADATGNWIDFRGSGLNVEGCYFAAGAKHVNVSGSSNFGIRVTGNKFTSVATAVDLGTGQSGCVVQGNDYQTVTTPIAAGDAVSGSALEYPPNITGRRNYLGGSFESTSFSVMREIADPGNSAADQGLLFLKDNGAGKTQLCVRFSSGVAIVLATQV